MLFGLSRVSNANVLISFHVQTPNTSRNIYFELKIPIATLTFHRYTIVFVIAFACYASLELVEESI